MTTNVGQLTDENVSEIDKALAAAAARKANKVKGNGPTAATSPVAAGTTDKRPRLTAEEKAQRELDRGQLLAERKAARIKAREEKRAADAKPAAHMRKVEKAAERLGPLGQAAEILFNEATANLTQADLAALALHIMLFNRVQATRRSLNQQVEEGQQVEIISGDPRWIGKVGTLVKSQRIRCYVSITDIAKPIYLFTSDVSPVAKEPAQDAATEDTTEEVEQIAAAG